MQLFHSATLKLTAWYLAILMVISIAFSVAIYQLNFHEVNVRLENFQNSLIGSMTGTQFTTTNTLRQVQSDQAALQMISSLFYINLIVLVIGGAGSYFLARRTLKPIEEAHEAQSRFTSDASHELRTPLTAIKTEIEVMLRDKKFDPKEARELMESNLEEVDKLIQLSEMLLNLSRLDYDRLEKKRLDLAKVLREVLRSHKDEAKRFTISGRKSALVHAHSLAITELITILIDNALKYSEPGTPISIRLFQRLHLIGLEITNTGPVIDEGALPHLFDRFYRADSSRTNGTKNGYGLGLAIAKKIVDVHDGDIEVESKDQKTVFRFFIPMRPSIGKITTK